MLVVGIDVGGTQIKFGLVENGNIIKSMELGTNAFDIIRQLCNGARELVQAGGKSWEEVDGIAIGFPGMVINSIVMDSPNVSLQNCNLKEILEKELGKYVVVKNDAEMATLAEHKLGAGADCENMVMITLGTGVGGGIIVNRKLYVGAGGAGELGHILFERNGRACSCGRKGCAEQYVSMVALDKLAKDIMVNYPNTCVDFNGDGVVFASEVVKAYKKNDACAIAIAESFVEDLTQYLLDLCNIFRPNRIVIGGGVTHAPELIDMVARNCRRLEYGYKNSPKVDILAAQLGNKAGVLGGYVCLEEELKENVVDEEYINEIEEEIEADSQNISLLDSIAMRLDKPVMETTEQETVEAIEPEEAEGLYVNRFLDDISSEINTIKNEQLFETLGDNTENESPEASQSLDTFSNIFEPVASSYEEPKTKEMYEEVLPEEHLGFNGNKIEETDWEAEENFVEESPVVERASYETPTYDNSIYQPPVVEEQVEETPATEEDKGGITVDSLLESLKNTTANLNSAMSKVGSINNNSPSNYNSSSEINTVEQYDSNAGISDIFFGSSTTEPTSQETVENSPIEREGYASEEQYTEEQMQETEVVYDDNLLSRVNAMLTKKNQE